MPNVVNIDDVPLADQPGVSRKDLGEFSERRTRISLYGIASRGSMRLTDHSIYFVACGSGDAGGRPFDRHATIYLSHGEHGRVMAGAREPVELLHIGLPCFS